MHRIGGAICDAMPSGAARARKNDPKHTGATELVRKALRAASEPVSIDRLSLATGLKRDKVYSAVNCLISKSGSVVAIQTPSGLRYSLHGLARKPRAARGSGRIAGPITHGRGALWGAGLV